MSDPKMTMEVPPQVRDFAVKSVDQAERAISSFLESASKSVAMVPSPMNDVGQQALAVSEKNLKASFEHARKLRNECQGHKRSDATANRISTKSVWCSNRTIQADERWNCPRRGDVGKEEPDVI